MPLLQPIVLGFGAPRPGMMLRAEDAQVTQSKALEVMVGPAGLVVHKDLHACPHVATAFSTTKHLPD